MGADARRAGPGRGVAGHFRRRGGSTLVDLTLDGVGRDPERLRRLATRTGVQLVMGCGWYRGAHYPRGGSH